MRGTNHQDLNLHLILSHLILALCSPSHPKAPLAHDADARAGGWSPEFRTISCFKSHRPLTRLVHSLQVELRTVFMSIPTRRGTRGPRSGHMVRRVRICPPVLLGSASWNASDMAHLQKGVPFDTSAPFSLSEAHTISILWALRSLTLRHSVQVGRDLVKSLIRLFQHHCFREHKRCRGGACPSSSTVGI
jgi:hypothetical protein